MKSKNTLQFKSGFTLIELLIVIAIMGILSSVVLVSLNIGRMNARDAERKQDLNQIAKALETYASTTGTYPTEEKCDSSRGMCWTVCPCSGSDWDYTDPSKIGARLRNGGYYANLPKDPVNDTTYYYSYEPNCGTVQGCSSDSVCCTFDLTARLERGGTLTVSGKIN